MCKPRLGVAYGLNFVELLVAAAMPCSAARAGAPDLWIDMQKLHSSGGPGSLMETVVLVAGLACFPTTRPMFLQGLPRTSTFFRLSSISRSRVYWGYMGIMEKKMEATIL